MRDVGCAEVGEIPNFSEDELPLSARIGASFLTKLFRHAYPGGFQFRISELHRPRDKFWLRSSKLFW
jgi:hypothetical protein